MFHTYRNKTYHLKMFLFNSAGVHRGPVRQQASVPPSREEQQRGGGRTLGPAGSGGGVHRDGCQVRFGNLLLFKSFDNFCKVFLRFEKFKALLRLFAWRRVSSTWLICFNFSLVDNEIALNNLH